MQSQRVDAGRVTSWYGFGWTIFMRNPGMWILAMSLITVMMLISQFVPFIGPLFLSLISPALTAGLMYGAKQAADGRSVEISYIFKGLSDESTRTPLLMLGGVMLGLSLLLMVAMAIIVGGSVGVGILGGAAGDADNAVLAVGALGAGIMLIFLVTAIFSLLMFAALAFAVPLVMFSGVRPIDAIKSSVSASLQNLAPLCVFLVIYFVLALIAAIPFFLGFLMLVPVTVAALYAAYRDIYATGSTISDGLEVRQTS